MYGMSRLRQAQLHGTPTQQSAAMQAAFRDSAPLYWVKSQYCADKRSDSPSSIDVVESLLSELKTAHVSHTCAVTHR